MPTWAAAGKVGDFSDVDPDTVPSIYDEANLGVPPKGPYLCEVGSIRAGVTGENSAEPGSPKLVVRVVISEPKGTKKAKYNGYQMYRHMPLTDGFAGRINGLLQALMVNSKAFAGDTAAAKKKRAEVIKAFWAGKVTVDGNPEDRGGANVTKIGTWVLPKETMLVGVNARPGKDQNDEAILEIGSVMPFTDAPKGQPADEEDEPEVDEEETEETDEEGEEDPAVTERAEELEGYTLAKLKTAAKGAGLTTADIKGLDKDELIEAILDAEFPAEDEDEPEEDEDEESEEDEDEADEEDEEGDEYDEMDRAGLRAVAKENGVKVLKSMSDDDLREAIRAAVGEEAEEEDEEEDEEPEPEPPAKPARRGGKATAAPKGRAAAARRAGSKGTTSAAVDDEPPF